MIRIAALNDSDSDEESSKRSTIKNTETKEAQEAEALTLYNKALRLQEKKDFQGAEDAFTSLLNSCLVKEAEELLDETEDDDIPKLVHAGLQLKYSAHKNIASMASDRGAYNQAIESYLEAVVVDATDVTVWFKAGSVALKIHHFMLAKHAFLQGLYCSPNHWPCLNSVISVLYALNNYTSCLYYVSRALERDPGYMKGLALKQQIYKEQPSLHRHTDDFFKISESDVCEILLDDEEMQEFIDEAIAMRKKQQELSQVVQPPELKPKESLPKLSWKDLGEGLMKIYRNAEEQGLPMGRTVDLSLYKEPCQSSAQVKEASDEVAMETNDAVVETSAVNVTESESVAIAPTVDDASEVFTEASSTTAVQSNAVTDETIDTGQTGTSLTTTASSVTETANTEEQVPVSMSRAQMAALIAAEETPTLTEIVKPGRGRPKGGTKRKRFLLDDFDDSFGKRRSARVRNTSDRKKDEGINYSEILLKFLPESLRSGVMNDCDDECDLLAATTDQDEIQEVNNTVVKGFEPLSKHEEADVMKFIEDKTENSGIVSLLIEYLVRLARFRNEFWPIGLVELYIEIYLCAKRHFSNPPYYGEDVVKDNIRDIAIMILIWTELKLDHWSTSKVRMSPTDNNRSPGFELGIYFPGPHYVSDLYYLTGLAIRSDLMSDAWSEFSMRVYWVHSRFLILQNKIEAAANIFTQLSELLDYLEVKEPNLNQVELVNCKTETTIDKGEVKKQLESLQRCQSLDKVQKLYNICQYSKVVDLLIPTFNEQQARHVPLLDGNSALPERHAQLLLLQDSLLKLGDYKQCLLWGEISFNEALSMYITSSDTGMKIEWVTSMTQLLDGLEKCLSHDKSIITTLSEKAFSRLTRNLLKLIELSMDIPDMSTEMVVGSVLPWIILYRLIQCEEKKGLTSVEHLHKSPENQILPRSFLFLNTAHETLGRHSCCTNCDGALLLFVVDEIWQMVKGYSTENKHPQSEDLELALEQCIYCLYNHPNKKVKARHLQDHNANPITLTWEQATMLFYYFKPKSLPEFDSYKTSTVSADVENLLRRIALVVPRGGQQQLSIETITNFIDGVATTVPSFPADHKTDDSPVVHEIHYLLADYYFKNKEQGKAIKFYLHDLCLNPERFDSWAGMALARSSRLEQKLNSNELKSEALPVSKVASSALRCFKRALAIDGLNSKLWIEYASFAYSLHAFYSRQISQLDTIPLNDENKSVASEKKDEMLKLAASCYSTGLDIEGEAGEELWLLNYMLGKSAEKLKLPPKKFLSHYSSAAECLHEEGARYPKKIHYIVSAPHMAIESLEVYFRIHSSITKFLMRRIPSEDELKMIEKLVDEFAENPFALGNEMSCFATTDESSSSNLGCPLTPPICKKSTLQDHDYSCKKTIPVQEAVDQYVEVVISDSEGCIEVTQGQVDLGKTQALNEDERIRTCPEKEKVTNTTDQETRKEISHLETEKSEALMKEGNGEVESEPKVEGEINDLKSVIRDELNRDIENKNNNLKDSEKVECDVKLESCQMESSVKAEAEIKLEATDIRQIETAKEIEDELPTTAASPHPEISNLMSDLIGLASAQGVTPLSLPGNDNSVCLLDSSQDADCSESQGSDISLSDLQGLDIHLPDPIESSLEDIHPIAMDISTPTETTMNTTNSSVLIIESNGVDELTAGALGQGVAVLEMQIKEEVSHGFGDAPPRCASSPKPCKLDTSGEDASAANAESIIQSKKDEDLKRAECSEKNLARKEDCARTERTGVSAELITKTELEMQIDSDPASACENVNRIQGRTEIPDLPEPDNIVGNAEDKCAGNRDGEGLKQKDSIGLDECDNNDQIELETGDVNAPQCLDNTMNTVGDSIEKCSQSIELEPNNVGETHITIKNTDCEKDPTIESNTSMEIGQDLETEIDTVTGSKEIEDVSECVNIAAVVKPSSPATCGNAEIYDVPVVGSIHGGISKDELVEKIQNEADWKSIKDEEFADDINGSKSIAVEEQLTPSGDSSEKLKTDNVNSGPENTNAHNLHEENPKDQVSSEFVVDVCVEIKTVESIESNQPIESHKNDNTVLSPQPLECIAEPGGFSERKHGNSEEKQEAELNCDNDGDHGVSDESNVPKTAREAETQVKTEVSVESADIKISDRIKNIPPTNTSLADAYTCRSLVEENMQTENKIIGGCEVLEKTSTKDAMHSETSIIDAKVERVEIVVSTTDEEVTIPPLTTETDLPKINELEKKTVAENKDLVDGKSKEIGDSKLPNVNEIKKMDTKEESSDCSDEFGKSKEEKTSKIQCDSEQQKLLAIEKKTVTERNAIVEPVRSNVTHKKRIVKEPSLFFTDDMVLKDSPVPSTSDRRVLTVIDKCIVAFKLCLKRFPTHYKSMHRLALIYAKSVTHKNINTARDVLLGVTNWQTSTFMAAPGLFQERKPTNFFNGIWRIPVDDIDRCGSFATHLYKSVRLLIEVLRELHDSSMLLWIHQQLQKTPEGNKKYIRDNERVALSKLALDRCVAAHGLLIKQKKSNDQSGESLNKFLLDTYKVWNSALKGKQGVVKVNSLLINAFKICKPNTVPEDGDILEHAMRYCQQLASKPQVDKIAKPVPVSEDNHVGNEAVSEKQSGIDSQQRSPILAKMMHETANTKKPNPGTGTVSLLPPVKPSCETLSKSSSTSQKSNLVTVPYSYRAAIKRPGSPITSPVSQKRMDTTSVKVNKFKTIQSNSPISTIPRSGKLKSESSSVVKQMPHSTKGMNPKSSCLMKRPKDVPASNNSKTQDIVKQCMSEASHFLPNSALTNQQFMSLLKASRGLGDSSEALAAIAALRGQGISVSLPSYPTTSRTAPQVIPYRKEVTMPKPNISRSKICAVRTDSGPKYVHVSSSMMGNIPGARKVQTSGGAKINSVVASDLSRSGQFKPSFSSQQAKNIHKKTVGSLSQPQSSPVPVHLVANRHSRQITPQSAMSKKHVGPRTVPAGSYKGKAQPVSLLTNKGLTYKKPVASVGTSSPQSGHYKSAGSSSSKSSPHPVHLISKVVSSTGQRIFNVQPFMRPKSQHISLNTSSKNIMKSAGSISNVRPAATTTTSASKTQTPANSSQIMAWSKMSHTPPLNAQIQSTDVIEIGSSSESDN